MNQFVNAAATQTEARVSPLALQIKISANGYNLAISVTSTGLEHDKNLGTLTQIA